MTVQDLIDICKDEGRDPKDMHLVMPVGGTAFEVGTSDSQDPWIPENCIMTLLPMRQV